MILQIRVTLRIIITFLEFGPFAVILSLLNVESQRQYLKRVLILALIVDFHVVVKGFLVGEVKVALHVIGRDHVVRCVIYLLFLFFIVIFAPTSIKILINLLRSTACHTLVRRLLLKGRKCLVFGSFGGRN